ncbi:MAG TPA: beta-galactosidase trimerization domain-containing protein [Pirellulales bacterium]|jgi:hypothetical protein|nr:beta-galactosidase trimerization domain-containing protein [Pirellulales bacterium]
MIRAICFMVLFLAPVRSFAQDDAYAKYVTTSRDFQPVKQDKAWALKAFPSWTVMPWYYQWNIGFNDASGRFQIENGMNGSFCDRGSDGRLDWIDKFQLRFYMDHTAGKGDLHQGADEFIRRYKSRIEGTGVRVQPVNDAMLARLEKIMRGNIGEVERSPFRGAYALDDEISWGHFTHPSMWRLTDDGTAYAKWQTEIYGTSAPKWTSWIGYNDILPKLRQWDIAHFDASQLMDQWTFNDSYWLNFIGDLVAYSNTLDPATPCGFVGGQAPSAFGGYDYAKLMRKVQYLESYNAGDSQSIIRGLNPHNALPAVTTFFYTSSADSIWQTWKYLANGNKGFICWVEHWFDGKTPRPWIAEVGPHWKEAEKVSQKLSGAEWIDDGVALYYNHASIQLGWIMDAESHGKTWINRNGDDRLGGSHLVRHAWINMLRDEGIQFGWLSYVDLIQHGVPAKYKVLILPATLCLSDAEAREIKKFCAGGGTVIADYLPGLWDQHGKGRAGGGVLDEMFGVRHDPKMTAGDIFGNRLWCETDQDANFGYKTYDELLTRGNTSIKDASGFDKAVRSMGVAHATRFGKGTAVLMNLSPQWYNAYRVAGSAAAAKRSVFMKPLHDAGIRRWVEIKNPGDEEFGYEITYWSIAGRTFAFVVMEPEIAVSGVGGGNAVGLKTATQPITLHFAAPIRDARDERSGKSLGSGADFPFDWKLNEAVVVSFAGDPPRSAPAADANLRR